MSIGAMDFGDVSATSSAGSLREMILAVPLARIGQFFATSARHVIPVGGVFAGDWHPATTIAVYWVESVLLVLATSLLCALIGRRTSPQALKRAAKQRDAAEVKQLKAEQRAFSAAHINATEVLAFHGGSLLVFAMFFGGILVIMVGNGHIPPMRWSELQDGAMAMLAVVAIGLLFDLWRFPSFTAADARRRVDACLVRWSLFWLLGFFGTLIMGLSGRATWFFGFFSALKLTFESWARVAQLFGWKTLSRD